MNVNALVCGILLALLLIPCFAEVRTLASGVTSENTWETKTAIPVSEGVKKAATVNGRIYVMGGSINYEYDPTTDNWTAKAPMPASRWHFGIAVYENKIYALGGFEASEVEVFDPVSNTWETKTSMPSIVTYPQATVINNEIYVISMESSYRYNLTDESWSTISNAPYGSAQVAMDGKIYAFYGNYTNIYDPKSNSWYEGTSMPFTVYQPSVCATTGIMSPKKIYLFGGIPQLFDSGTTLTQVYDPEVDTWTLGSPMPTGRSSAAIAVVNDQIYVIGGSTGLYWVTDANEQYIPLGYGTIPPIVSIVAPEDKMTYNSDNISLVFTVNRPVQNIRYSLDGQSDVTLAGNITLTGLVNGLHNVTVYTEDAFGNIGASETIIFSISETNLLILTAIISVAAIVVGVGIIIFFNRRKIK